MSSLGAKQAAVSHCLLIGSWPEQDNELNSQTSLSGNPVYLEFISDIISNVPSGL